MNEIVIRGTVEEELTSDDYDALYDTLMQLGFENIKIDVEENREAQL